MAHHKRGRRKNARAGCLHCKSYKRNGASPRQRLRGSDRRRLESAEVQQKEQVLGEHQGAGDESKPDHRREDALSLSPRSADAQPMALVLSLETYRNARRARDFVAGTLAGAAWVLGVKVRLFADGTAKLVIQTAVITDLQRRCLPTAVNAVRTLVEECK